MNHKIQFLTVLLLISVCVPAWAGFFSQVTPQYDPGLTASDQFGITGVQVSQDGLIVMADTPYEIFPSYFNDGEGSGYLYKYSGYQWSQLISAQFISTLNQSQYGYGFAMSKDGGTAIYGNLLGTAPNQLGEADFWEIVNGIASPLQMQLDPTSTVGTGFGTAVALSGNGNIAVIGAPNDSNYNGAAYIYTYNSGSGNWVAAPVLTDPNGTTGYSFGAAVAVSADGSNVLIGNVGGTVYVYNLAGGVWTKVREFDNVVVCQGCMALSADGQSVAIATGSGITVYSATDSPAWSGTPIAITDPSGPLDMSADGTAVVIGTSDRKAFLYQLSSGNWSQTHEFDDPTSDTADGYAGGFFSGYLGSSVAISDDKETVAISAGTATVNNVTEAGAIYIYQSSADLSLAMTANPSLVALNQQTTLDITAANNDTQVTAYNVILTDTLPAGLTYVSSNAAGGTCGISGSTVTCTLASLAPGATWQPSVTVKVTTAGSYNVTANIVSNQPDPDTTNNTATVNVSMLPPTVTDGHVTSVQDTPVNGTLTGNNPCNCGTLVFSVVTQPSHGSVTITNTATGAFTYTPAAGYFGNDSFTFQLANGLNTSGTATEHITVTPALPTVSNGSVITNQGTAVNGILSGANPCNCGTLVFSVVTQPGHGSVVITDSATGAFTYTPAAGYSGSDSFTFQLTNGTGTSSTATESITVNAVSSSGGSTGGSTSGSSGGGGGAFNLLILGLLSGLLLLNRLRMIRR